MSIEQGPTPRVIVADQIRTDNPLFAVEPYPYVPSSVQAGKVIVSVFRTDVDPVEGNENQLQHPLTIHVYVSATHAAKAEDQADDALDAVLLSLQRLDGVTWTKASRQNFANDSIVGWVITAGVRSPNVYKQTVTSQ